jgi:hypothetical protein
VHTLSEPDIVLGSKSRFESVLKAFVVFKGKYSLHNISVSCDPCELGGIEP